MRSAERAAALRPPRHGAAARAGRAGARRRTAGRTPTTAILGADNKAAVAVHARARAPACAARARRSTSSCCSPSARRSRWRARKAFDARPAAQRVRLRLRPRLPDRRDRRRLADLLPPRGRVPRRGRARRASAPRTGAARSSPPRARSSRDAARAPGRADDGQRRHDRTAGRRDQRRARALPVIGRGAQPRPRPACEEVVAAMVDAPPRRRQRRLRVRRRRRRRAPLRRATGRAGTRPGGARSPSARCGACGHEPVHDRQRRRLGRQRADRRRLRRASTSPTAPSATTSPTSASASPALEGMLDVALALLDEPRPRRSLMLELRRGDRRRGRRPPRAPMQQLVVAIAGAASAAARDRRRRSRRAPPRSGDEVIVNVAGAATSGLGLGRLRRRARQPHARPGGRGLARTPHVMKLNYTSLQHAVAPVGGRQRSWRSPLRRARRRCSRCTAARRRSPGRSRRRRPGARLGYVQTAGGALPGGHSRGRARAARARPAGRPSDGRRRPTGERARRSRPPARSHHGLRDARLGRRRVRARARGSSARPRALGHGGMVALDSAHVALALGLRRRCSSRACPPRDPRERHRGLSHHTRTVLELLLEPVTVRAARRACELGASPSRRVRRRRRGAGATSTRLRGQRRCPARDDGPPTWTEDPLFFARRAGGGDARWRDSASGTAGA